MTIGDVLAVVAFIFGAGASSWALFIGLTLLFPNRAALAQSATQERPWRCLLTGIGLTVLWGGAAIVLLNGSGPLKLMGWALLIALMAIAALGAAGLAAVAGKRTLELEPQLSPLGSLARGTALLLGAGLVPLVGWFFIAPLVFIFGAGAGSRALWKREKKPLNTPVYQAAQPVSASPLGASSPLGAGGEALL